MALPAAAAAVVIWGYRAYRAYAAYETAQTAKEAAEMALEIARRKDEVKKLLDSTLSSLKKEIDLNIATLAAVDHGGRSTVSRRGTEATTYRQYIERRVPFRPAISVVCNWALAAPIKVPRRIRRKIPGEAVESTIEIALKQTTASLVFEAIDDILDWKSPLKAEPNYNGNSGKAMLGEPPTRPMRVSEVFPFWPRPRGSLAPDLVIVEYRQQPFEVDNVFVAVEIKFPGDWVKQEQMDNYVDLMGNNTRKVALLRVPEDCSGFNRDANSRKRNRLPR
ncbi:VRR-NUC domain-containing protein [Cupriavidus sp. 30B13]|uniref:VRR-NUC domain-containing protein n=1 Tax=Cupriavidus sp. 30B13 TaxID=3384241 RepID=UPI003B90308F